VKPATGADEAVRRGPGGTAPLSVLKVGSDSE